MPGGDRTGPRGMGPATGWGRGYCIGQPARLGMRRGRFWGRGRGLCGDDNAIVPGNEEADIHGKILAKLQALEDRLSGLECCESDE